MKKNLQSIIFLMSVICVLVMFLSSCPIGEEDQIIGEVTLDMQGGTGGSTTVTTTFEMPMPSAIAPTLVGHTFGGYYNESGDTQYYTSDMDSANLWTDDILTLYAKWIPYGVGNLGPSGGVIFYDCDADNSLGNPDNLVSTTSGWRYLEVAPSAIVVDESLDHIFGYYRNSEAVLVKVGATDTSIGTGQANTTKLVTAMGDSAYISDDPTVTTTTEYYAANLCDSLSITTCNEVYDDWFLPSKDELNEIYLKYAEGSFADLNNTLYWSSSEIADPDPDNYPDPPVDTESSEYQAWLQAIRDGETAWRQDFGGGEQIDNSCKKNNFRVRAIRAFI